MSYPNPLATTIPTIGLDGTITVLQEAIADLYWIGKSFHRAYRHAELNTGQRTISVPKTWQAGKEWINVLPNDNIVAQSFFWPISDESVIEFDNHVDPLMESEVALIVWCNTSKISGHNTGPSLAYQKADILALLKSSDLVTDITGIVDRNATEIFDPFTINDELTQYTMLPYQGFRINFTVKYTYALCLPVSS
jgi:hypothetical protein